MSSSSLTIVSAMDIDYPIVPATNASSQQFDRFNLLEALSYDTILQVLSWLSPRDLCKFALVSKDCQVLSCEDDLWRGFYPNFEEQYMLTFSLDRMPSPLPRINAKSAYIKEYQKMNMVSKFVGLWSEKWCDVDVTNSTKITYDGQNINVHYTKNKFSAIFQDFDGETLRFKLTGGDSGWSFFYCLTTIGMTDGRLALKVNRLHDNMEFAGFFKQRDCEPTGPLIQNHINVFDTNNVRPAADEAEAAQKRILPSVLLVTDDLPLSQCAPTITI
eukprot:gene19510-23372_t